MYGKGRKPVTVDAGGWLSQGPAFSFCTSRGARASLGIAVTLRLEERGLD